MSNLLRIWAPRLTLLLCLAAPHSTMAAAPLPDHWREAGAQVYTVAVPYIDVHTFAGRGYPIFHVVEHGEKILVIKRRNDWFNIETLDGKAGWVAREHMNGTVDANNIALDFSTPSWRERAENRFEAGLTAGSLEGAVAYTPYIAYHFTPNIHGELKYTQAFGEFSNLKLTTVSLTHQPFPSWRISPFFRLGSGVIQTNPSTILVQSEDREDPIFTVGGGLVFSASNHLVLRVEYNNHIIMTTRNVNEEVEEWKAGFGVLF
ncbi:MAG TPA: SH3 domain-containing protein [Marinagarivorans sp.]